MRISAEYVPLFYFLFGLFMAGTVALTARRFFRIRAGIGQFVRQMEAKSGIIREKPGNLQGPWPEMGFPRLQLPVYSSSWNSWFLNATSRTWMAIGTGQRQDEAPPWLWFEREFRYRVGQVPEGTVTVTSSDHQVALSFHYSGGEESADVTVDGQPFGRLRVDVYQAPYFLADVELFDADGTPAGRWRNVPANQGPMLHESAPMPPHGEVTIHGHRIGEMLVFFPKRWKKGRFQEVIDHLHLFFVPDPSHPAPDQPLVKDVSGKLSETQRLWLLALVGLQVSKLSFRIPGKKGSV